MADSDSAVLQADEVGEPGELGELGEPGELEEPGEEGEGIEGTEMWPDAEGIFRRQSQRKKPRVCALDSEHAWRTVNEGVGMNANAYDLLICRSNTARRMNNWKD